jgi:hypothetical protein
MTLSSERAHQNYYINFTKFQDIWSHIYNIVSFQKLQKYERDVWSSSQTIHAMYLKQLIKYRYFVYIC